MSERPYITALLNYEQADFDGIIVKASRQAIHETVDELARLKAEVEAADAVISRLNSGEELQALMRTNNALLAEVERKDAALNGLIHAAHNWAGVASGLWLWIKTLKEDPAYIDHAISNGEETYNQQAAKWHDADAVARAALTPSQEPRT